MVNLYSFRILHGLCELQNSSETTGKGRFQLIERHKKNDDVRRSWKERAVSSAQKPWECGSSCGLYDTGVAGSGVLLPGRKIAFH